MVTDWKERVLWIVLVLLIVATLMRIIHLLGLDMFDEISL